MDQSSAGDPAVQAASNTTEDHPNTAPPDPEPMYKAKIPVEVDKEICEALCDTGCQRSCISEQFILKHPNLFRNEVKPFTGKTVSIDGSKVQTIGVINIGFRIKGRFMRANCRIVRNLVYDFVLGWDFFSRYKCSINPSEGHITFENEQIDFFRNSLEVSSTSFALAEDVVIPPFSKMIPPATFHINPEEKVTTSNLVEVEPLLGYNEGVAVGRSISKVVDGRFPVELLNPYPTSRLIKANDILGSVSFTSDVVLESSSLPTDIVLAYISDPESSKEPKEMANASAESTPSKETPPRQAPPSHKPSFDYSNVAKDAEPYLDQLKNLLEVKHADTFSRNDRDWGKTDLITYQANMKPGPPIAVPPY